VVGDLVRDFEELRRRLDALERSHRELRETVEGHERRIRELEALLNIDPPETTEPPLVMEMRARFDGRAGDDVRYELQSEVGSEPWGMFGIELTLGEATHILRDGALYRVSVERVRDEGGDQ
jgi:hypothetical protein